MILEMEEDENYLAHYGILRKSGRYPWNSGKDLGQPARNRGFLDYLAECKREGLTEKDISDGMGVSIANIRDAKSIALNETKLENIRQAEKLRGKGMSHEAIKNAMGLANESSVRALLAPGVKEKAEQKAAVTTMLKEQVEKHGVIDVGRGVESHINISAEQLRAAVGQLQEQGYEFHKFKNPQSTTVHKTDMKVLAKPGITQKEIFLDPSKIKQIDLVMSNDGKSFRPQIKHPLVSIHPDRLAIKYGGEGGEKADGVIYVRPGVEDVSLGKNRYAQVRVKVGDDHYLKGMAMYKEDLPKGKDLVFNTNKTREDGRAAGDEKLGVLKKLEKDSPDYPFGSVVRQQKLDEHQPTERVVSAMNFVNEEGNWKDWGRNISAQTLSKQSPTLAKNQLSKTYDARKEEYERILSYTNPVVQKKLLQTFADATDKSAVHLKAAALERQNWRVILPIDSLKPGEIYAPGYKDGESVVLIRYPHGGTFEIPELRVNNKHRESIALLSKEPRDAVGIHHSVAERLSGADFDGDTVLVIPNDKKTIKVSPALESLKDFNPRMQYKLPPGVKSTIHTQQEMGKISNLITDMTLMGASHDKIARAVKHSMVVIDAEKHDLDHKRSFRNHSIAALKEEYQSGANRGAATLISRAKSELRVPDRKARPHGEGGPINTRTGELEFVPTGRKRRDKQGNLVDVTIKTTKLAEAKDAHILVSNANTRVENIYAEHSNRLKNLANQARLSMINQPKFKHIPSSKKAYAKEVESLHSKLVLAKMSAPRERQAQIIANKVVAAERASNPTLDKNSIKKIQFRALEEARQRMGVHRTPFIISKEEWAAIQAGAISEHVLKQILDKADLDVVREHATPRSRKILSKSDTSLAMRLLSTGRYTRTEVAERLGVSVSTLDAATINDAADDEA